MPQQKLHPKRNEYRCIMEVNQTGKYCVRVRAGFGRHDWTLPVYFMASSFDRAVKKLEQALQFLQRHEDKLWFWGVERTDDPNLAGELLAEAGLKLDRRAEFLLIEQVRESVDCGGQFLGFFARHWSNVLADRRSCRWTGGTFDFWGGATRHRLHEKDGSVACVLS